MQYPGVTVEPNPGLNNERYPFLFTLWHYRAGDKTKDVVIYCQIQCEDNEDVAYYLSEFMQQKVVDINS